MNTLQAIQNRRSIRKFQPEALSRQQLLTILQAGTQAPSAKNRQPWEFVVVQGNSIPGLLTAMRAGIQREKQGGGLLPQSVHHIAGAENSMHIMGQASANILVFDASSPSPIYESTAEQWFYSCANHQSIGAAIQNMCLAATAMGLGSLWVCDVFFAWQEIMQWAGKESPLVAALSLGVPAENPAVRPRKTLEQTMEWRG